MKIYKSEITVIEKIDKVKCNCCGNEITADANGYTSDYLSISKRWGYNRALITRNIILIYAKIAIKS